MNANSNLVINVISRRYRRDENGRMIFIGDKHDHWIGKKKHVQPHMKDIYGQDGTKLRNRTTKKKYKYKKKGTGGYGR